MCAASREAARASQQMAVHASTRRRSGHFLLPSHGLARSQRLFNDSEEKSHLTISENHTCWQRQHRQRWLRSSEGVCGARRELCGEDGSTTRLETSALPGGPTPPPSKKRCQSAPHQGYAVHLILKDYSVGADHLTYVAGRRSLARTFVICALC